MGQCRLGRPPRTMTRLRVLTLALCVTWVSAQAGPEANILEDETEAFTRQLCKGKEPGEWFRLSTKDCRDVIQCTEAGLQALRCPHGLAFDLELQTCDWNDNVQKKGNCGKKEKVRKVKPLFNTVEPLCQNEMLACGDGTCMDKQLFCDGKTDCPDASDETVCGMYGSLEEPKLVTLLASDLYPLHMTENTIKYHIFKYILK